MSLQDAMSFLLLLFREELLAVGLRVNLRGLLHGGAAEDTRSRFIPSITELSENGIGQELVTWNRDRSIYFGPGLREGADGKKRGVRCVTAIWSDLDAKALLGKSQLTPAEREEGKRQAWARIRQRLPEALWPSVLVDTAGGIQAWWFLKEPAFIGPDRDDGYTIATVEGYLKGLAKHLGADPSVAQLATMMRLPGFVNRKYPDNPTARILECHPDRRFNLRDFDEYLVVVEEAQARSAAGDQRGPLGQLAPVVETCGFIQSCRDHPADVREPDWYAMLSNLARLEGGREAAHAFSRGHPGYSPSETDAKIDHALASSGPHTCAYIQEHGFTGCPVGGHGVKSPAGLGWPRATGAPAAQDLESPPLIHLVDLERTEYVGCEVQTDILIAGVGETFHVPRRFTAACDIAECQVCPRTVALEPRKELLNFCRMSDAQMKGYMRHLSQCPNKPQVKVEEMATITELLALPVASSEVDGPPRAYREKFVALVGTLSSSQVRYRATGQVIAEPKRQRASLLITRLERLQSDVDGFRLTDETRQRFRAFQPPVPSDRMPEALLDAAYDHLTRIVSDVTRHITKIHGKHRETILCGLLLTFHSPSVIRWSGEEIKGVIDGLVIGDTGQGKTTQARRLVTGLRLGQMASGSTASRTGILYSLDSKVNETRILRWGAYPLAHGGALVLDEAQNTRREEWREFSTARSEGVLKVDRAIRAEHPSRVRLLCFANPLGQRAMASFQYGIMAVHPESGFLELQDLRRFDFVGCVAEGDQATSDIFAAASAHSTEPEFPPELLRESVLWAWTRRLEHLRYAPDAENAIKALAKALNDKFGATEIPLVVTGDAHEKVARLAFAFAALLHSTDAAHEQVIVTPVHVGLVGRFLEALYTHPNCAFDQFAMVLRRRSSLSDQEYGVIASDLLTARSNREDTLATEAMLELFLTEDGISRPDLEAATGLSKDALTRRIGKLRQYRLVQSVRHGYRKTPRFVAFLRRWAKGRPNQPNPPNHTDSDPKGGVS